MCNDRRSYVVDAHAYPVIGGARAKAAIVFYKDGTKFMGDLRSEKTFNMNWDAAITLGKDGPAGEIQIPLDEKTDDDGKAMGPDYYLVQDPTFKKDAPDEAGATHMVSVPMDVEAEIETDATGYGATCLAMAQYGTHSELPGTSGAEDAQLTKPMVVAPVADLTAGFTFWTK